ncbi:uncharacterized protein GLRG_02056 [Colletotrichum graminicola M1.001]|uniref:Uncharacterized protein n=1 Tax=Colletotrichum graminicola (strain M1.001 / M2 / FGSC 10212) TaxID=645133 RepID=E3Q8L4_COLGM|nr:uncharacterized protein GLRG_02056 [Colletotrichum graminicola M1.001]EFQ26885.1 hypothetical protein GLRG_02056 [Colletotrichum graminicola M1.001]
MDVARKVTRDAPFLSKRVPGRLLALAGGDGQWPHIVCANALQVVVRPGVQLDVRYCPRQIRQYVCFGEG